MYKLLNCTVLYDTNYILSLGSTKTSRCRGSVEHKQDGEPPPAPVLLPARRPDGGCTTTRLTLGLCPRQALHRSSVARLLLSHVSGSPPFLCPLTLVAVATAATSFNRELDNLVVSTPGASSTSTGRHRSMPTVPPRNTSNTPTVLKWKLVMADR